jgi:hypothetical protein
MVVQSARQSVGSLGLKWVSDWADLLVAATADRLVDWLAAGLASQSVEWLADWKVVDWDIDLAAMWVELMEQMSVSLLEQKWVAWMGGLMAGY